MDFEDIVRGITVLPAALHHFDRDISAVLSLEVPAAGKKGRCAVRVRVVRRTDF